MKWAQIDGSDGASRRQPVLGQQRRDHEPVQLPLRGVIGQLAERVGERARRLEAFQARFEAFLE
jgi:hypothetical protein